ncbi:MAG TPA: zinc-ribbon domain-containing protein [Candidatus Mediterraneibacter stercoripullorum]|nr:zinc-ribbon domain-containing protein [Candidatus Mediterraneibacter stercoripullorum]
MTYTFPPCKIGATYSTHSAQSQGQPYQPAQQNQNYTAPQAGSSVCPSCGASVPAGSKFCLSCGAKMAAAAFCPNCGKPVPAGARFCPECGSPTGQ